MATFRGVSVSVALIAMVIGLIALFSSPAVTEDFWSEDLYDQAWCSSCYGVGSSWACMWIGSGNRYGWYYCDQKDNFEGPYWTACQGPCTAK